MTDKLAKQTEGTDTALAVAREQSSIMRQVGTEVAIIPGVDKEFRYRLPRLGKIHLGVKVERQTQRNGQTVTVEYPKATDFFVLPDDLKNNTDFQDALAAIGETTDRPQRLPIMLPCNSLSDNLRRSCDLYGSSRGLLCRTFDGMTCKCVDTKTGEMTEKPCDLSTCPRHQPNSKGVCECDWIHRMRVILPDAPGIGVWQIDTGSPNNYANLLCEMKQIKTMLGGKLAGIDLFLTLEPQEFQVPMKKQGGNETELRKTIAWMIHIRSELSLRKLQVAAAEAVAYEAADVEDFADTIDDAPIIDDSEEVEDAEEVEEVDNPGEPEPVSAQATEEEPATRELRARVAGELFRDFPVQKARQAFLVSIQGLGNNPPDLSKMSQDQLVLVRERLTKRKEANRTPNTQGTLDEPMPTE